MRFFQPLRRLFRRGPHTQLLRRRQDRFALDRARQTSVDADERLPDQGHAIKLAVEVGFEDVSRCKMHGRPVVPERDVSRVPLEPHGIFRPCYVLPQDFEDLLAFAGSQPDDRFQGLTYSTRSPVSACTVTSGCSLRNTRRFPRSLYSLRAPAASRGTKAWIPRS